MLRLPLRAGTLPVGRCPLTLGGVRALARLLGELAGLLLLGVGLGLPAPCLPEEFLAAYVKRVGAITAGIAIFGARLVGRGLSDSDDGSMSPA